MKFEIYSVYAKGDFEQKINLTEIVRLVPEAQFNENFKGGRVDIKLIDADTEEFIGKIQLFSSGKFMVSGVKSEEDAYTARDVLESLLQRIQSK